MKKLEITKEDLEAAASEGVISNRQVDDLWGYLSTRLKKDDGVNARFDLAHLAWYSGAVIVMLAMGWFLSEVWDRFNGGAVLFTSLAYALLFALIGRSFWRREGLKVPGGLLFTLAVCMTPLTIFALERIFGMWAPLSYPYPPGYFHLEVGRRLVMEVGTVIAGLVVLRFIRFPFLTAPITFALWLISFDVANYMAGHEMSWNSFRWVTMAFGLVMLAGSYVVDRRTRGDYAFWGYLFGCSAFWLALTLVDTGSELSKFIYFLINLGLMLTSILLNRKVFVVFGSAGAIFYLGHLTYNVFANSQLFPVVLSLLGLGIIFLGVRYNRNRAAIDKAILGLVPQALRRYLPGSRETGV